jgi:hypothetical protein
MRRFSEEIMPRFNSELEVGIRLAPELERAGTVRSFRRVTRTHRPQEPDGAARAEICRCRRIERIPVEAMARRCAFDLRERAQASTPPSPRCRVRDSTVRGAAGPLKLRIDRRRRARRSSTITAAVTSAARSKPRFVVPHPREQLEMRVDLGRLSPVAGSEVPEPVEDCYTATVDIVARARSHRSARLAVGDSAGGNFAAVVCQLASNTAVGDPLPAADLSGLDAVKPNRSLSQGLLSQFVPFCVVLYP